MRYFWSNFVKMDNYNSQQPFSEYTVESQSIKTGSTSKTFVANVFLWMFAALAISALCAYLFATNEELLSYLITETPKGVGLSLLGKITMFAPLGFVLLMSLGFNRLSSSALVALFLTYSAIMGISLSFILLSFTAGSVVACFVSAAGMFGLMAVLGYTTKQDLTSFGRIMMMGLIGIVIATIVNWFMHSAQLDYVISFIGVLVFTGLTAYDVQKIKRIGAGVEYEGIGAEQTKKLSIMGALNLYLDFINLFLFLLRIFGKKNN
jgi:FtsH-binding integral membrane protein